MRLRPLALPPILLGLALVAAACAQAPSSNAGAFRGSERKVAQAVFDLRDAIAQRDYAKVCDGLFTPQLRDEVVRVGRAAGRGSTCAEVVKQSLQDVDATDIEMVRGGIAVTGSTATARIRTNLVGGARDPVDTLTLADERGWRISKLPAR